MVRDVKFSESERFVVGALIVVVFGLLLISFVLLAYGYFVEIRDGILSYPILVEGNRTKLINVSISATEIHDDFSIVHSRYWNGNSSFSGYYFSRIKLLDRVSVLEDTFQTIGIEGVFFERGNLSDMIRSLRWCVQFDLASGRCPSARFYSLRAEFDDFSDALFVAQAQENN